MSKQKKRKPRCRECGAKLIGIHCSVNPCHTGNHLHKPTSFWSSMFSDVLERCIRCGKTGQCIHYFT